MGARVSAPVVGVTPPSGDAGHKEDTKRGTGRRVTTISVYFVVLLLIFLGYKGALFHTNMLILSAIYRETPTNASRADPLTSAVLEAIPSLVPVCLYTLLLPSMLGCRLYDFLSGRHRGPRRRLFIMTLVMIVSGLSLTAQVITYVFQTTLLYLEQIPEVVTCTCRRPDAPLRMMSEGGLYVCHCYIPGHGDQTLFSPDPLTQINEGSLREVGLDNPFMPPGGDSGTAHITITGSVNGTAEPELVLMGAFYQMLPYLRRMQSMLQIYVVIVALRLPIYLMINNFRADDALDRDPESRDDTQETVARQQSEDSAGYGLPRMSSVDSHNYAQISELRRLTRDISRLTTYRATMLTPPLILAQEEPTLSDASAESGHDAPSRDVARRSPAAPFVKFMFPVFTNLTMSDHVTSDAVKEARRVVKNLKRGALVSFAIEICYHGFVEIVDAYSLVDEIIQNPDYFKSNMALTYVTLTCLGVTLLVFTVGNFFVTHPGKSAVVNRLIKAALLTVNNLPSFIIRCYLFWEFTGSAHVSTQIGSVFLLFTIKEIAVLVLGFADLIITWRADREPQGSSPLAGGQGTTGQ